MIIIGFLNWFMNIPNLEEDFLSSRIFSPYLSTLSSASCFDRPSSSVFRSFNTSLNSYAQKFFIAPPYHEITRTYIGFIHLVKLTFASPFSDLTL